MTSESLWGDLGGLEAIRVPTSYLKEQASILTKSTGGLLLGEVNQKSQGDKISVDLDVVVPSLGDYRLNVVHVLYPLSVYPLDIQDGMTYDWEKCPDESAFLATLKTILSAPHVRKALATLVAQSRA
jgi:hypothetical protein